jgi:F-box protein 11
MSAAATAAFTGSTSTPDVNGGSGSSSSNNGSSGSSSSHHSPYDLRRKSPPHHYAAASTSGTPVSSVLASTNYSASMLPARKRPRRTCSVTNESEYFFAVVTCKFNILILSLRKVT